MLHIELALYIIAFSLGTAALIVSLIAHARYQRVTFRDLAFLLLAVQLIILVDILKIYNRTADAGLRVLSPYVYAVLSAAGFGLLAYIVPRLASGIVLKAIPYPVKVIHAIIGLAAAVLGSLREIIPGILTPAAAIMGLVGVQAYGIIIIIPNLDKISNQHLRSFMRTFSWLVIAGMAATCAELAIRNLMGMHAFPQDSSVVEITYLLTAGALLLTYAFIDLFKTDGNLVTMIPDAFIQRFGISPRESQIISMMIQGYSNRRIGEELFISSITVKNHIYHIYQKTSVENKIQLINLINPPK